MSKTKTIEITIYKQEAFRIKEKICEQLDMCSSIYEYILDNISVGETKNELAISKRKDSIEILNKKVGSDILYELSKSLFAKDLSRITNLLVINVKVNELLASILNVVAFYEILTKRHKVKIKDTNNKFVVDMIKLLIKLIKELIQIIETEDKTKAHAFLKKDDLVDKLYKSFLMLLIKDNFTSTKISNKENVKIGYTLTIKSLEKAGDIIHDCAKEILKIEDVEKENA